MVLRFGLTSAISCEARLNEDGPPLARQGGPTSKITALRQLHRLVGRRPHQSSHSRMWFFTRSVKAQRAIVGGSVLQSTKSLLMALTKSRESRSPSPTSPLSAQHHAAPGRAALYASTACWGWTSPGVGNPGPVLLRLARYSDLGRRARHAVPLQVNMGPCQHNSRESVRRRCAAWNRASFWRRRFRERGLRE